MLYTGLLLPGGMKVKNFRREDINEKTVLRRQQSQKEDPNLLALYPQESLIIVVKLSAWLKIREAS